MKYADLAASALALALVLGLTACASVPESSRDGRLSLDSEKQIAEATDRRARNARIVGQMYEDFQSTNERLAERAESERVTRRALRGRSLPDQQALPYQ